MSGVYTLFWFPFEAELMCACRGVGFLFRSYTFFLFLLELHAGSHEEAKVTPNKSCTKKIIFLLFFLVVGDIGCLLSMCWLKHTPMTAHVGAAPITESEKNYRWGEFYRRSQNHNSGLILVLGFE